MHISKIVLNRKLKRIKLVVLDTDGVLARGIYLDAHGKELKVFWAQDATKIKVAVALGLKIVIISARNGKAVRQRSKELGVPFFSRTELGQGNELLVSLEKRFQVSPEEILYMGDDWPDLPYLQQVGVAAVPGDGQDECKELAHIITKSLGGCGAVAEMLTSLLKAQGLYEKAIGRFLSP